jgi:hypothetical protein
VRKACSKFIGGRVQSGDNLDRLEWTAQASLHIAKSQNDGQICRRFVGGSARNRAVLGNPGQPVHGMQSVQSRINTGDCSSR